MANLTPSSNMSSPLFNAIIPVISGYQNGSAAVTYRSDNQEAAALIKKIRQSPPAWFFDYWINVRKYKLLEMVQKLMESLDVDAALLARFSEFDSSGSA